MSKCYITNGVTQDGFGSRLQRAVNVMTFALHLKDILGIDIEYIHTPMSYEGFGVDFTMGEVQRWGVYHPYNLESRRNYLARTVIWDNALDYKGITVRDINLAKLNVRFGIEALMRDLSNREYDGNIYVVTHLHKEFDFKVFDINIHNKYRDRVVSMFAKPTQRIADDSIAVHIRRQDAINDRHIPDGYYLSILHWIKKYELGYKPIIFTQREGFNAYLYDGYEIIYDDQEEDYISFWKLVEAEILVCGHSSFSYLAGLLNSNTVVYHGRGHIAMNRWITKQKFINRLKDGKILLQSMAIG